MSRTYARVGTPRLPLHLPLLAVAAALVACPTPEPVCEQPASTDLRIGTGTTTSGFVPLAEGDDLAMFSVRHEWNRYLLVSLRATGAAHADDDAMEIGVGIRQDGELVGGVAVADAVATAGTQGSADFLGLTPRLTVEDSAQLSGFASVIEADFVDGCGGKLVATLPVVLWTADDLCDLGQPVWTAELGLRDEAGAFAPLADADLIELEPTATGFRLELSALASGQTSPLARHLRLLGFEVWQGAERLAEVTPDDLPPASSWTREWSAFDGIVAEFDASDYGPEPGDELTVELLLRDGCSRLLSADVTLYVTP